MLKERASGWGRKKSEKTLVKKMALTLEKDCRLTLTGGGGEFGGCKKGCVNG